MGNEDYGKREENHNENRIEGRHGVLEAFRAEQLIERLFVQRGCKDGPVMSILREAKKSRYHGRFCAERKTGPDE